MKAYDITYVNVHIAVVQTAHDTENTALCGNHRRASFVFRQNGGQFFGGYIIHKQPQRFGRLKFGKLRSLGADIQKVDEPDPTAEEKLLRKAL